jgi:hypothetical protein
MNDLGLVTSLRPDIDLPGPDQLTAARGRLDAALAAASAGAPAHGRPNPWQSRRARGPRRTRPRLAVATAAVAAASAGITAIVAVPGRSAPELTISVATAHTLRLAAAAALRQPGPRPQPDQFIYTATRDGAGQLHQSWISVDGTRTSLVRGIGGTPSWAYLPGCRHGREQVSAPASAGGTSGVQPCTPSPAYLPDLPASQAALGRYLRRTQELNLGSAVADLDSLGHGVADLLEYVYLTPRQLAAVYQLMASTPGFTLVPGAADALGRHGIGIRWPVADGPDTVIPGDTDMIIFDPHSGAYLGQRTTYPGQRPAAYSGDAVAQRAIVDRTGQLPPGARAR